MKANDFKRLLTEHNFKAPDDLEAAIKKAKFDVSNWIANTHPSRTRDYVDNPASHLRLSICVAAKDFHYRQRIALADFNEVVAIGHFIEDYFTVSIYKTADEVINARVNPEPSGIPDIDPDHIWLFDHVRDFLHQVKDVNVNAPDGAVLAQRVVYALALNIRDRFEPNGDRDSIINGIANIHKTESIRLARQLFAYWLDEAARGNAPEQFQRIYDDAKKGSK